MRAFFAVLLAAMLLASCGGTFQNISSNYDHLANFTVYKSYAWLNKDLPHTETPYDNEIVENNIKNYVDKELENRNLIANANAPDLLFELILSDKEKVRTTTTPIYSPPQYSAYPSTSYRYYSPQNYRWNPHGYSNYNYTRPGYQIGNRVIKTPYNRSTITINVFDRKSNRLIWAGTAKGDVYDDNYKQEDIHPAIIKILNQYPVKANSKE